MIEEIVGLQAAVVKCFFFGFKTESSKVKARNSQQRIRSFDWKQPMTMRTGPKAESRCFAPDHDDENLHVKIWRTFECINFRSRPNGPVETQRGPLE
jgi:hypothetical protein